MGTLFVDKLDPQSGTSLEIGSSGDTITIPSGATITNNGTQTGFGGANTPAFHAKLSANQSISNESLTKVAANTELFDTDNAYDNSSNYRFTPQTAGKYIIYTSVLVDSASNNNNFDYLYSEIHKNGTDISFNMLDFRSDRDGRKFTISQQIAVDMNGSSDYIELFAIGKASYSADLKFSVNNTYFGGYKLITW